MRDVWLAGRDRSGDGWDEIIGDTTARTPGEVWGGFTGAYGNNLLEDSAGYGDVPIRGVVEDGATGELPYLGTHYFEVGEAASITVEGTAVVSGPDAVGSSIDVSGGDVLAVTGLADGASYRLAVGAPSSPDDDDDDDEGAATPGPPAAGPAATTTGSPGDDGGGDGDGDGGDDDETPRAAAPCRPPRRRSPLACWPSSRCWVGAGKERPMRERDEGPDDFDGDDLDGEDLGEEGFEAWDRTWKLPWRKLDEGAMRRAAEDVASQFQGVSVKVVWRRTTASPPSSPCPPKPRAPSTRARSRSAPTRWAATASCSAWRSTPPTTSCAGRTPSAWPRIWPTRWTRAPGSVSLGPMTLLLPLLLACWAPELAPAGDDGEDGVPRVDVIFVDGGIVVPADVEADGAHLPEDRVLVERAWSPGEDVGSWAGRGACSPPRRTCPSA
ncbi:MAG: hypothetical protein H6742_17170 [Alphaproteobacteria bacterium]|nr:hypothetical protein [Alphaproteobacteria bacterium]